MPPGRDGRRAYRDAPDPDFHCAGDCAGMSGCNRPRRSCDERAKRAWPERPHRAGSMSDDLPDLEPIDLAAEPTRETPTDTTVAMPAPPAPDAVWPAGWYSDPWTAGQYRYWTGQTWTGETNRWGPTNAGLGADPWPPLSAPVTTGYGLPTAPAPTEAPKSSRRGPIVAAVVALILLLVVSATVGYLIDANSRSDDKAGAPSTTTPGGTSRPGTTTPANNVPSTDPDRDVLGGLVVQQADVGAKRTVLLIPNGNFTSQPTLDLCNGTFPSERLRTARLQVAAVDAAGVTLAEHGGSAVPQPRRVGAGLRRARRGSQELPRPAGPEQGGRRPGDQDHVQGGARQQVAAHAERRARGVQLRVRRRPGSRTARSRSTCGGAARSWACTSSSRRPSSRRWRANARSPASCRCSRRGWRSCRPRSSTGVAPGANCRSSSSEPWSSTLAIGVSGASMPKSASTIGAVPTASIVGPFQRASSVTFTGRVTPWSSSVPVATVCTFRALREVRRERDRGREREARVRELARLERVVARVRVARGAAAVELRTRRRARRAAVTRSPAIVIVPLTAGVRPTASRLSTASPKSSLMR